VWSFGDVPFPAFFLITRGKRSTSSSEGGTTDGAREGSHDLNPARTRGHLIEPIKEYGRSLGLAAVGGYVYRGSAIPALAGVYVYGDWASGRIWGARWDGRRLSLDAEVLDSEVAISAFALDRSGELYVLDYQSGAILKVFPSH
jgi:hypothetical protein